ncbi:MAG: hypothetical protein R3D80_03025 [Paracoccaceae bacterium]|nr:hypothetical protein [Maritimibacter sp.]
MVYAAHLALCPKTWSTSPRMMDYDISAGNYSGDRAAFERNAGKEGKSASGLGPSRPAISPSTRSR